MIKKLKIYTRYLIKYSHIIYYSLAKRFLIKIIDILNLKKDIDDYEIIHNTIEKDVIFKGTNLWILIAAIIIASVGLNINSTAVIIGAMLVSPLMGPINGIGYSISTFDLQLFKKALKNFSFAVITSLITSTGYFLISPISTTHSELLARTSPTIYDVIIALFGGLAGIIAISSKKKGNVIPGVAIATALLPPLCTAGYGIAMLRFDFFFGAFYLFIINTAFIALSSILVSQILKFPIRSYISSEQKRKINRWISAIIAIIIIPSIFFGYKLILKEQFNENAARFIEEVRFFEGNFLIHSTINPDKLEIKLLYGGTGLSEDQQIKIKIKTHLFKLQQASVEIRQGIIFEKPLSPAGGFINSGVHSSINGFLLFDQRQHDSANKTLKDTLLQ